MKNLILIILFTATAIVYTEAQTSHKQTLKNQSLTNKFIKSSTIALNVDLAYFINQKTKQINYTLDLDAYGIYELLLTESNLISESLRSSAKKNEYALNYKGIVKGKPESVVALTVNKNYLAGFIKVDEQTIYFEPNFYTNKAAKTNELIIYNGNDVVQQERGCSASHHTKTQSEKITEQYNSMKNAKTACDVYKTQILLAATYDMFEKFGDGTSERLNAILNGVIVKYAKAFNNPIEFEVVGYYIAEKSTQDSWSRYSDGTAIIKGGTLLKRFKEHMQSLDINSEFNITKYDLASLWTYRELEADDDPNKKLGGIAYREGVCRYNSKFNVINGKLNYTNSIISQSHEIGHNFGATHDDCGTKIMNEFITPYGGWSRQSITEINNFYPTASCLCLDEKYVDLVPYEGLITIDDEPVMHSCDPNNDLKMQVINKGSESAGSYKVGIYLSEDNIITKDDEQIFDVTVSSSLKPGRINIIDFDDDLFKEKLKELNIASGHYYRGYIIENEDEINEIIKSNNIGCVTSVNIETQKDNNDADLALQWNASSVCNSDKHKVAISLTNNYNTSQQFKITVHDGAKPIHGSHIYTIQKNSTENISLGGIPIGRYQLRVEQKSGNIYKLVETRNYNFKPCGSSSGVLPNEIVWDITQSDCVGNKRSITATVNNINENSRHYRIVVYSKEGFVHASEKHFLRSNTKKTIVLKGIRAGQFHIVMENEGVEISKIPANVTFPDNTEEEDKIFSYALYSCNGTSVQDKFTVVKNECDSYSKRSISIDVTNGSTQSQFYNITVTKLNGQFVHGSHEYFIPTKKTVTMQLNGIPFGEYNVNVLSDCEALFTKKTVFESCGSGRISSNPTQVEHYNYPNPFSSNTTISFNLPVEDEVSILIYNAAGKKVATLAKDKPYAKGINYVNFNATNLPQGVYSYSIQTSTNTFANKMLLIK